MEWGLSNVFSFGGAQGPKSQVYVLQAVSLKAYVY